MRDANDLGFTVSCACGVSKERALSLYLTDPTATTVDHSAGSDLLMTHPVSASTITETITTTALSTALTPPKTAVVSCQTVMECLRMAAGAV